MTAPNGITRPKRSDGREKEVCLRVFSRRPAVEYGYDDIGNRTTTKSGGDGFGNKLRAATYSVNALNQVTSHGVPGAVDVIGTTTNTAIVTVNNQAAYRHGDYFWKELALDNTSGPVYQTVTNLAVLNDGTNPDFVTTITGEVYVSRAQSQSGEGKPTEAPSSKIKAQRKLQDPRNQGPIIPSKAPPAS